MINCIRIEWALWKLRAEPIRYAYIEPHGVLFSGTSLSYLSRRLKSMARRDCLRMGCGTGPLVLKVIMNDA